MTTLRGAMVGITIRIGPAALIGRMQAMSLREKASLQVLLLATVIGGLVTFILVLQHVDRQAAAAADGERAAQLSLDRFSLTAASQRLDVEDYLLTRDPGLLDRYRAGRQDGDLRAEQLTRLATSGGVDSRPVERARLDWQAWADAAVQRPAADVDPATLARGRQLFDALVAQERQLGGQLDDAASQATGQAGFRDGLLAFTTPAVGALLLFLLLVLWWQVVSHMLRPIDQLAETARSISRGEAPEIPGLDRRDELGQLAKALAAWRREATHRLDLANTVAAEKEQQARTLELLNQSASAASGVLDPAALERLLAQRTSILLGGADALVACYSAERDAFDVVVHEAAGGSLHDLSLGLEGLFGETYRSGTPVVVRDYPSWPRAHPVGLRAGVHSMVAVPLVVGERRAGVLAALTRDERRLDEHDLQVLALLSAQAAPALEAARLHAELVTAHEQLTRTNEELARANRHKGEFLASMSHELRTPLNAILGFSELVLDDEHVIDPARRTSFVRHIHNSGKHLLTLINDILDLSKVDAGRMDLRPRTFDLTGTIGTAVSTVEPLADKKGIALSTDSPGSMMVQADEDKVRQILLNLLANAIKFTKEGGQVGVMAWREPGRMLMCVADNGIGIAPEDQERIFEEFEQLDTGEYRRQGTGLGLALTKRLTELHGGRVWVESEPGVGSRFVVELPDGVADEQLEGAGQPADGRLVLVVEDDPGAATLLVDTLRRDGYRTAVVRDGARAADEAALLQPFAITLDVHLPGCDGWDVLRAIKSSERTRNIPLVVVSVVDERARGLALGADDYLVKPVDRGSLLAAITRFREAAETPARRR